MAEQGFNTLSIGPVAGVDALGNSTPAAIATQTPPAPAAGVDMLTNDPSKIPGVDNISGGANIFQRLVAQNSPVLQSPHVQDFAKKTEAAAVSNPQAASAPGGWARTLVAGALGALGGIGKSLGDVAAVGTVPEGAGGLTGAARTLAARTQRQRQEKLDVSEEKTKEAQRAETVSRIALNTRNVYKQDQEFRTADYANNQKYMSNLRKDYQTSDNKDNITQNELNEMLKNDPNFWKTHTGRPVGEETITNPDGTPKLGPDNMPVKSPLYSISNIADAKERTRAITKEESDFIQKYAGDKLPPNTELKLNDYDNVIARATGARNAMLSIEKANDEDMTEETSRQMRALLNDPHIQQYIAQVPGEPLAGLYNAHENSLAHIAAIDQKIAAVQKKVPNPQGGQNPVIGALQKQRQQFVDGDQKIAQVITGLGEKAQNDYFKDVMEQRKDEETARHNQADEAIKAREVKVKETQGDPDVLAQDLVDHNMDPSQLSKKSATYNATLAAADRYSREKYGKPFDIAQAQTDYKYANRGDTQNTLKYLGSLTGKDGSTGNLGELVKRSNNLTRTEFPALNDAAAWARLQTGDPNIVGYRTTVTEVADQVAKILQGGGTGNGTSDAKLKQAQELFDSGFTKGQIIETAAALGPLLNNRRDSLIGDNPYLQRQFGKPSAPVQETTNTDTTKSKSDDSTKPSFHTFGGIALSGGPQ